MLLLEIVDKDLLLLYLSIIPSSSLLCFGSESSSYCAVLESITVSIAETITSSLLNCDD